jgi:hypothetical protein
VKPYLPILKQRIVDILTMGTNSVIVSSLPLLLQGGIFIALLVSASVWDIRKADHPRHTLPVHRLDQPNRI